MKPFMPPPPPGAQPPPLWGSEEHLQALMGGRVEFQTLERDVLEITAFERPRDYARALQGPLRTDDRRPGQRRPQRAARPSSTRRWTGSATSGTAATVTRPASRRSTCSRSAQGCDPGALSRADRAGILAPVEQLPAGESLIEGMQAMERADWESARVAFEAVLASGESADAREGLGQALWFLGDVARRHRHARARVRGARPQPAAATTPRAWRCGCRTSTSSRAAPRRPAAGWPAPSGRWRMSTAAPVTAGWRSSGRVTPAASRSRSATRAGPWRSRARTTRATSRCSRSACSAAPR